MQKEELREKYLEFLKARDLDSQISVLDIYTKYFFEVISKQAGKPYKTKALAEASVVHQMMFTKLLSIQKLIEGISYYENGNQKLNTIIDPTTILSLIRNVYETAFTFSLIFRKANEGEQREIAYYLWVIAGLNYRQKFSDFSTLEESKRKIKADKETIDNLTITIKDTDIYNKSEQKVRNIIDHMIRTKDFKLIFEDDSVKQLHWGSSREVFELDKDLMDQTYNYFSLYAHPSNVSVFQFADMFDKEEEGFKDIINLNLKNTYSLYSFFIADYIHLFPDTLEIFEDQPKLNQIIIDYFNLWMRDDEFSINNAHRYLE
jgi:hypothetical protein